MHLLRSSFPVHRHGLFQLSLLVLLLGCGASNGGGSGGGGSGSTQANGTGGSTATGIGGEGGIVLGTGGSGGGGGGVPLEAEVFAHSSSVLYRLDPTSKAVTTVGTFNGCSSVIDIAIDKDGIMFGTTFGGLYRIDKLTATCTFIASGSYPNSLSLVPVGTVDPNEEALVGYFGGDYTRINKVTGAMTTIGNIGGGYTSSGDIVSVIGGGTYLTVKGNGCGDCILEVNPTTGAMIQNLGSLNHTDVFGLAFWGGVAYGFSNAGQLFEVNLMDGSTTDIPIPGAPAGLSFWGAGSTTSAPVVPPE